MSGPRRDTESNKVHINLSVDTDKVKADAETVKEKTTELTGKVTEEAKELSDEANYKLKSDDEQDD